MATIKERLSADMKESLKSGQKDRLTAIRNLHAAIRKKEIDDRVDLNDDAVMKIIASLSKQRQDSIDQFKAGNRQDLVDKEMAELKILQSYLPQQFTQDELTKIIEDTINEVGAKTIKEMGQVMKALLPKVTGKADNKMVSQIVNQKLNPSPS